MADDCVKDWEKWQEYNEKYNDLYNDAADEAIGAEDATNDAFETCADMAENPLKIPVCAARTMTAATHWQRAAAKAAKAKGAKDLADSQADAMWDCMCHMDDDEGEDAPAPSEDGGDVGDFDWDEATVEDDDGGDDGGTRDGGVVPKPKGAGK